MVSIYKEYNIYHIQIDLPSSPRCHLIALRCTPSTVGLDLMGWMVVRPMSIAVGTWGYTPHTHTFEAMGRKVAKQAPRGFLN